MWLKFTTHSITLPVPYVPYTAAPHLSQCSLRARSGSVPAADGWLDGCIYGVHTVECYYSTLTAWHGLGQGIGVSRVVTARQQQYTRIIHGWITAAGIRSGRCAATTVEYQPRSKVVASNYILPLRTLHLHENPSWAADRQTFEFRIDQVKHKHGKPHTRSVGRSELRKYRRYHVGIISTSEP